MYRKDDAITIKNKVERDGKFLWKMDTNFITRVETVWYLYANEEERNKHIEYQKAIGWDFYKDQKHEESFHTNFFKDNEDVLIYVAYFTKKLKPIDWHN